jgi:hypothetical protein
MTRAWLAVTLMLGGIGVMVIGYTDPTLIGRGARPYAYLSVIAIGAMLTIFGGLASFSRHAG